MQLDDYRIYVVLFSPGHGGNHLANLISTSTNVANRVPGLTKQQYIDFVTNSYRNLIKDAHIFGQSGIQNCGVHNVAETAKIVANSSSPYVLCGHIDEFYYVHQTIKSTGKIKYITLSCFEFNDHLKNRSPIDVQSYQFLYRKDIIQKILVTDDTMVFDPNWLFTPDISNAIDFLNHHTTLNLDMTLCKMLHSRWFNRVVLGKIAVDEQ